MVIQFPTGNWFSECITGYSIRNEPNRNV